MRGSHAHLAQLDGAELARRLELADIAFAFVNEVGDLLDHPELTTADIPTEHGLVRAPAPAARIDGSRRRPGAVPALGAQDAAVRAEFLHKSPG